MKKNTRISLLVLLLILTWTNSVLAAPKYLVEQDKGSLIITSDLEGERNLVQVSKDGIFYNYKLEEGVTEVPLQLGNGNYELTMFRHKEGNKYLVQRGISIIVKEALEKDVYLGGSEKVSWRNSEETIKKAKELTKELKTDKEKVEAIHSYVYKNIKYNDERANSIINGTISPRYHPNLDSILKEGKGICYDYSSLFAGMLRSQGIPTKLLMGYTNYMDEYHAWNEVLIDGKWIVIDTTDDATFFKAGRKTSMEKKKENFLITSFY